MEKITFVKPVKPFDQQHCDIDVYGNYTNDIMRFVPAKVEGMNILHLSYFKPNRWRALHTLPQFDTTEVETLYKKVRYACPYTDRMYQALLPMSIFSKDVERYFSHFSHAPWFKDMACDKNWNLLKLSEYKEFGDEKNNLTIIDQLIMGSGYTDITMINDGGWEIVPVLIELSNEDYLYCATFVWYNK